MSLFGLAAATAGGAAESSLLPSAGRPLHFLSLADAGPDGLRAILDAAHARKAARRGRPKGAPDDDAPLAGYLLAAIFEKPSTRTRVSFDVAMRQLGGAALVMTSSDMQLGRGETIADTARVLSRYVDLMMIRTHDHAVAAELAAHADVPVVNGLTDHSHPCQVVADLLTVEERLGRPVAGTRWAWCGDGNNMAHSLIEAAGLLGFELRLGCPDGYHPDAAVLAAAGGAARVVGSAAEAAESADVVVTDAWVSMGQADSAAKSAAMEPFRVDEALMARAASHAVFLHCLPAHRGEEVVDAVIDGPRSAVWDEAENRVHAQKAILLRCAGRLA